MSAFVVSKATIDAMVTAIVRGNPWQQFTYFHDGERHFVESDGHDLVGHLLYEENIRSVAHRYREDKRDRLPGPNEIADEYQYPTRLILKAQRLDPVKMLRVLGMYEYQTCEHPGWWDSEAKAIVEALRDLLIDQLPGYKDAPGDLKGIEEAYA